MQGRRAEYDLFKREYFKLVSKVQNQLFSELSLETIHRFFFRFFGLYLTLHLTNNLNLLKRTNRLLADLKSSKGSQKEETCQNITKLLCEHSFPTPNGNYPLFSTQGIIHSQNHEQQLYSSLLPFLAQFQFSPSEQPHPTNEGVVTPQTLGFLAEEVLGQGEEGGGGLLKRKNSGTYYTPLYFTKIITEKTILRRVMNQLFPRRELRPHDLSLDVFMQASIPTGSAKKFFFDHLPRFTVLDNSCGSGMFLGTIMNVLGGVYTKLLRVVWEEGGKEWLENSRFNNQLTDSQVIACSILRTNLYGTDLNSLAIFVTHLRLYLSILSISNSHSIIVVPDLRESVVVGNALVGWVQTGHLVRIDDEPTLSLLNELKEQGTFTINQNDLEAAQPIHWSVQFPRVFRDGGFELIVGNPPYVRHENIAEKQLIRSCLALNVPLHQQDNKADLYAYFIAQATVLLKSGGLLGYIFPNKWMDVGYGRSLKKTILDVFLLYEVHQFAFQVFEGLEVTTGIFIMQKQGPVLQKPNSDVKFFYWESPRLLEEGWSTNKPVIVFQQKSLGLDQKWSKIPHRASFHQKLLESRLFRPLHKLARVTAGDKTGATKFFYPNNKLIERFQLPVIFLHPCAKGSKAVKNLQTSELTDEAVQVLVIPPNTDMASYPRLETFIQFAETTTFDAHPPKDRKSVRSGPKSPWYSLQLQAPPSIMVPNFHDKYFRAIDNDGQVYGSNAMLYVNPTNLPDKIILLASLNSFLGLYFAEILGRSEGGGALQLMCNELEKVLVADPAQIGPELRDKLTGCYGELSRVPFRSEKALTIRLEMTHLLLAQAGLGQAEAIAMKETVERLINRRLKKTLSSQDPLPHPRLKVP